MGSIIKAFLAETEKKTMKKGFDFSSLWLAVATITDVTPEVMARESGVALSDLTRFIATGRLPRDRGITASLLGEWLESRGRVLIVRRCLAQISLPLEVVSDESGVSVRVLKLFIDGSYRGDKAKLAIRLAKWLERRRQQRLGSAYRPVFNV